MIIFLWQFKPLTLAISIIPLRKKLGLKTELLQSEIVNSCSMSLCKNGF